MEQKLYFYPDNCTASGMGKTAEEAAEVLNSFGLEYDSESGDLSLTAISEPGFYSATVLVVYDSYGTELTTSSILTIVTFDDSRKSVTLNETNKSRVLGFKIDTRISALHSGLDEDVKYTGKAYLAVESVGNFIYPTGEIDFKSLPITQIGFSGQQAAFDYSHVQIIVAELLEDGTITGEFWQSQYYDKDIDFTTSLENIIGICEGKQLTRFNVAYNLSQQQEDGSFLFVRSFIANGATNVTTFSVRSDVSEEVVSLATLDGLCYCLSSCVLTVNRKEKPEIEFVRVEVSNYIADFEFYQDRNLLEIDLAEYLQTLFSLVDLFEFQQMQTTVVVKFYNSDQEHIETQGLPVTVVYGKKPDPLISGCEIRVQWLDKYAVLHDEYFRIVDNQTEGASKQKYVVNREEREDKTGEKSITLAKVLANNAEREALKTIVFADHVRAYISNSWKRVKIANSYKTGTGREKKNFEITIKYSL